MKPSACSINPSPRSALDRWGRAWRLRGILALCIAGVLGGGAVAQTPAGKTIIWKPVPFAIMRYNEGAPRDWNIYHTERRGVLLVRLWKRYMLVNVGDEEIFDIDPQKIKHEGENVTFSSADIPEEAAETSEWKVRDVGPVERIRFRFRKNGNFLEIEVPMLINGKPAY